MASMSEIDDSNCGTLTLPAPARSNSVQQKPEQDPDRPWLWNVVLLDSDHHSYEYVMELVMRLFGFPLERAFKAAQKVDQDGRAVLLTTHKELAELKIEQIRTFGRDPRVAECSGAMSALIEPAMSTADESDCPGQ
jgi:ATP-dependent Clp protease adaptor protein ClpS